MTNDLAIDQSLVETTLTELDFIAEHWADLLEARHPGTSRPWRQALLDPERRAEQARRDAEERAQRDPDAPGFTAAPLHIDVLDVIVDIWTTLDQLATTISPEWHDTDQGALVHRIEDIDQMLAFVRLWLPEALPDEPTNRKLWRITRRITSLGAEITRVLSLVRAGQILNGAICPWCRGITPRHPAGDATTLRVEEIPGSKTLGTDPVYAVVCWNPLCTPPDDKVGTWYRGRPAWPWHEWDWLAPQLIIRTPVLRETLTSETPDEDAVIPIVHSGRSGIDQTVCVEPASSGVLDGVRFIDAV